MLYNTAYGAAYYHWYHVKNGRDEEGFNFVRDYLLTCYKLIKDNLPEEWKDYLVSLILIPENDSDIRERILKRGRPSEVANIDNMLEVNNYFMYYLGRVLDHYDIPYTYETVKNRVD